MKASTIFNAYVASGYRLDQINVEFDEADEAGEIDEGADQGRYARWQKLIRQQTAFRRTTQKQIKELERYDEIARDNAATHAAVSNFRRDEIIRLRAENDALKQQLINCNEWLANAEDDVRSRLENDHK